MAEGSTSAADYYEGSIRSMKEGKECMNLHSKRSSMFVKHNSRSRSIM